MTTTTEPSIRHRVVHAQVVLAYLRSTARAALAYGDHHRYHRDDCASLYAADPTQCDCDGSELLDWYVGAIAAAVDAWAEQHRDEIGLRPAAPLSAAAYAELLALAGPWVGRASFPGIDSIR